MIDFVKILVDFCAKRIPHILMHLLYLFHSVCSICENDKGKMLNSLNCFYKSLLQGRFSSFNQSFGGKNAPNFAFTQSIDNELVTKPPIFQWQVKARLNESKGNFEGK